jgi:hypothetical protein
MADRRDANRSLILGQLIDDAERADTQRAEPSQPATQRMPGWWIALKQPQRLLYGVDERAVELEQLTPSALREDDASHRQRDERRTSSSARRSSSVTVSSNASYSSIGTSAAAGFPLRVTKT